MFPSKKQLMCYNRRFLKQKFPPFQPQQPKVEALVELLILLPAGYVAETDCDDSRSSSSSAFKVTQLHHKLSGWKTHIRDESDLY